MSNLVYKTQDHPNPNYRTFHVKTEVPFRGSLDSYTDLTQTPSPEERNTAVTNPSAVNLFKTEGVESISSFGRYEFSVKKGNAFEWEEIFPGILAAVKELFGVDELVELTPEPPEPATDDDDLDRWAPFPVRDGGETIG